MSYSRPLKIHHDTRTESEHFLDSAVARLVLNIDGTVLFANAVCEQMAGGQPLKGRNPLTIAALFMEPEEAFRHFPLLFAQEDNIFIALRSGLHEISFFETGNTAHLQFDLARMSDGKKYVIASALEQDDEFGENLETIIHQNDPAQVTGTDAAHFLDLSNDLLTVTRADGTFNSINEKILRASGLHLRRSDRAALSSTSTPMIAPRFAPPCKT